MSLATLPFASYEFTHPTGILHDSSQLAHPSPNTVNYGYPDDWAELYNSLYPYQQYQTEEMKKRKEKEDKQRKEIQLYMILLIPYFAYSRQAWGYFAACELMEQYLKKLGLSEPVILIVVTLFQALDIRQLKQGRWKLVSGSSGIILTELFDEVMELNDVSDLIRLGSQMLLPQTGAPQYSSTQYNLGGS